MLLASEYSEAIPLSVVGFPGFAVDAKTRAEDIPAQLSHSALFAGLPYGECVRIAGLARARHFGRSQMLFGQGDPFRSLILVLTGCVKLTRLDDNGSEIILALRGQGEAIELPAGTPICDHASSAAVVVNCTALSWTAQQIDSLITHYPQISRNISAILTRQIHDYQKRFHEASVEKVERRLACTLIRIGKQFGRPGSAGVEIRISRQELAQMSGTTLFTVSRLISKWSELGLVLPRREAVLMLNPDRLDYLSSIVE